MKRLLLVSFGVVFALSLCVGLYAQMPTRRTTNDDGERTYVLVEKTGDEVNCTMLSSQKEVNNRIAELQRDNAERLKGNKAITEEVNKLTGQLTAKKRELANAKDDAAKQEVQTAIDDLTSQIAAKKSEAKLMTTWLPPKYFGKRADADKFIEQVVKQAEAMKEKAEKKKEKEAEGKKK